MIYILLDIQAQEAHEWCRQWLKENASADVAQSVRIIYGGMWCI